MSKPTFYDLPLEIVFRRIRQDMPENWLPGMHWYVEAHDGRLDMAHPVGIAFVTVIPALAAVDYVLVDDTYRRKGVATRLVRAILDRWPHCRMTDGQYCLSVWVKAQALAKPTRGPKKPPSR